MGRYGRKADPTAVRFFVFSYRFVARRPGASEVGLDDDDDVLTRPKGDSWPASVALSDPTGRSLSEGLMSEMGQSRHLDGAPATSGLPPNTGHPVPKGNRRPIKEGQHE